MARLLVIALLLAAAATQIGAEKTLITQRHCSSDKCDSGCSEAKSRSATGTCMATTKSPTVKSIIITCDDQKYSYKTYTDGECKDLHEDQGGTVGCEQVILPAKITSKKEDGTYVATVCKRQHGDTAPKCDDKCHEGKQEVTFNAATECTSMKEDETLKKLHLELYYMASTESLGLYWDAECSKSIGSKVAKNVGDCVALDDAFSKVQCVDSTTTTGDATATNVTETTAGAASTITVAAVLLAVLALVIA